MKKLVNHNGTVQYKWVVATQEELFEYIEQVASKRIGKRVANWTINPSSDIQMQQLYEVFQVGAIELVQKLTIELYTGASKALKYEKALVFNEAGGYCFWDDEEMKLLDWEFLLEPKDVIVLENGNDIEKDVVAYLKQNDVKDFLFLNLEGKTNEEIFYYCSKASTIVFKTQGIFKKQIESLLILAEKLEPKTIVIVNSPYRISESKGLKKHNVVVIEEEYEKPKNS